MVVDENNEICILSSRESKKNYEIWNEIKFGKLTISHFLETK